MGTAVQYWDRHQCADHLQDLDATGTCGERQSCAASGASRRPSRLGLAGSQAVEAQQLLTQTRPEPEVRGLSRRRRAPSAGSGYFSHRDESVDVASLSESCVLESFASRTRLVCGAFMSACATAAGIPACSASSTRTGPAGQWRIRSGPMHIFQVAAPLQLEYHSRDQGEATAAVAGMQCRRGVDRRTQLLQWWMHTDCD